MNPVERYFTALADIRASGGGVKESSGYPALINLLNAVGEGLKPRVLAVSQLRNSGAGSPDAGLFAASQLAKTGRASRYQRHGNPCCLLLS